MIIDGKKIAAERQEVLAKKVKNHLCLGIIVATDNQATHTYVRSKQKTAEAVGYRAVIENLGPDATEQTVLAACEKFNQNPDITGYIVQLPLPQGVDPLKVGAAIDPAKDADGLTPTNLGYLFTKQERVLPATPKGILTLLESVGEPVSGREVTVVGKGLLVGLPIAALLSNRGATVTSCDSKTRDLAAHTKAAEILITAVGKPGLITGEMVGNGAVVIDVGTTKLDETLKGDVDFASVEPKAKAITPVPGGVGPMTVISLLENVYELSKRASAD